MSQSVCFSAANVGPKHVEAFAKATHTTIGYYFGGVPLVERVSIADFRTIANTVFCSYGIGQFYL